MLLILNEPADPCQVVVAIADLEWREFVISKMSPRNEIYDIYQDPDRLLSQMLEIPAFFYIMDYRTYKKIEEDLKDYRDPEVIEEITPILIYGVGKEGLIKHPCIIDGDTTHPHMISSFFLSCRNKARNL